MHSPRYEFMAAEIKSACFCNILQFCHVVICVTTCTVHSMCSHSVYPSNIIVIVVVIKIIIIIILRIYPTNKWRAGCINWRKTGWKMSRVWCHTNPVNIGQSTKCETNNKNWKLPHLVSPKCALQRQRFTKHQHASLYEQMGKMYNILRPWYRDVEFYNEVAKNTCNKGPYTRSIWWGACACR